MHARRWLVLVFGALVVAVTGTMTLGGLGDVPILNRPEDVYALRAILEDDDTNKTLQDLSRRYALGALSRTSADGNLTVFAADFVPRSARSTKRLRVSISATLREDEYDVTVDSVAFDSFDAVPTVAPAFRSGENLRVLTRLLQNKEFLSTLVRQVETDVLTRIEIAENTEESTQPGFRYYDVSCIFAKEPRPYRVRVRFELDGQSIDDIREM